MKLHRLWIVRFFRVNMALLERARESFQKKFPEEHARYAAGNQMDL